MAKRTNDGLWFTRAQCAALLGITARHFDESIRPKLAAEAVRGDRRDLRFHAAGVVYAWTSAKTAKLEQQLVDARMAGEDPLLWAAASGDSAGLERLRLAKAKHAELDLRAREGELVDVAQLEPAMLGMADVQRRYGEIIAQRFGGEAAAVWSEAVDEWIGGVEKLLNNANGKRGDEPADAAVPPDRERGEAAAHPHDAAVR